MIHTVESNAFKVSPPSLQQKWELRKVKNRGFLFVDNWLQQRRKNLDKIDMQLKAILWKDFWKQVGSEEEDKKENWRQSNDNGFLF